MAPRVCLAVALLVVLTACGVQAPADPQTANPSCAPGAPCATPLAAAPTTPATMTTVPTAASPTAAPSATATHVSIPPTVEPSASAPAAVEGRVTLQLGAGSAADQVGIAADAGPPTFRVAADGSLRIMDPLNRRILFFAQGTDSAPQPTEIVDLGALKQPLDFAVTGQGDLYVLDGGDWTIQHLTLSGRPIDSFAVAPEYHGAFRQISLTAEGWLTGLGTDRSYALMSPQGPLPAEEQLALKLDGLTTVRTNARFIAARSGQSAQLTVDSLLAGLITPTNLQIEPGSGTPRFLDVNQGMEPYVLWQDGPRREVRRYGVDGSLLGVLQLPSAACRAVERSIYVDRVGDVYTMCVTDTGMTITSYTITDADGQPLPPTEALASGAPWSPDNLQAAPG